MPSAEQRRDNFATKRISNKHVLYVQLKMYAILTPHTKSIEQLIHSIRKK